MALKLLPKLCTVLRRVIEVPPSFGSLILVKKHICATNIAFDAIPWATVIRSTPTYTLKGVSTGMFPGEYKKRPMRTVSIVRGMYTFRITESGRGPEVH